MGGPLLRKRGRLGGTDDEDLFATRILRLRRGDPRSVHFKHLAWEEQFVQLCRRRLGEPTRGTLAPPHQLPPQVGTGL